MGYILLAMGAASFVGWLIGIIIDAIRTHIAWRRASRRLGFRLIWGPHRMILGTRHGVRIRVEARHGWRTLRTRYTATYPSLGIGFKAGPAASMDYLTDMLRGRKIVTGDEEFDEAVGVRAADAATAAALLTRGCRDDLRWLVLSYPRVSIGDGKAHVERIGIERDPRWIEAIVLRLTSACGRLSAEANTVETLRELDYPA